MSIYSYLTIEELERISKLNDDRISATRDILLFSCLTGLKFSEVESLRKKDIYTDDQKRIWLAFPDREHCKRKRIYVTEFLSEILNLPIETLGEEDCIFSVTNRYSFKNLINEISRVAHLHTRINSYTGVKTFRTHIAKVTPLDIDNRISKHYLDVINMDIELLEENMKDNNIQSDCII